MVSICMAYYNRPQLLRNTLWAYCHLYRNIQNYEFVIVDDGSDSGQEASSVAIEFKGKMNINCIELGKEKTSNNPAIPINISVKEATGEFIVIQNPECIPMIGMLGEIGLLEVHCGTFMVVPCYAIGGNEQTLINELDPTQPDFLKRVTNTVPILDRPFPVEGEGGWYEHPTIIPRYYYFMAAMKKEDFILIGGIDEDFSEGIAFEDDDFSRRLSLNRIPKQHVYGGLCFHQNHYKKDVVHPSTTEGWERNAALYNKKAMERNLVANVGKDWT